jgi:D-alanine-D-alanine ligase-like ATP-grasp enzyme
MTTTPGFPAWVPQALDTADQLKDTIGVLLVANLKGRTTPIDDYETDSIATEFLSTKELDDFIQGFERAGIYCEVVLDESGFLKWLDGGQLKFGRPRPLVYNVTQNGTGPARFSLVPGLCRLHRISLVDSDAYTVALGQHKFHFISLLENFGLPVARSWWFTRHGWWPARPPAGLRVIAKPTLDSASVGIHRDSVFLVDAGIESRLGALADEFRQAITVQEFVPGFEVEVPVLEALEPRACMAVGIQLHGRRNLDDSILAYDDVFTDGYDFYDFSEEDREQAVRMMEFACRAHVGLGFVGPSRIDFRVSAAGEARIMEVTCKPHLTTHTSFAHAMKAMGHSYADLLKFVVGSAALRLGIHPMSCGLESPASRAS